MAPPPMNGPIGVHQQRSMCCSVSTHELRPKREKSVGFKPQDPRTRPIRRGFKPLCTLKSRNLEGPVQILRAPAPARCCGSARQMVSRDLQDELMFSHVFTEKTMIAFLPLFHPPCGRPKHRQEGSPRGFAWVGTRSAP